MIDGRPGKFPESGEIADFLWAPRDNLPRPLTNTAPHAIADGTDGAGRHRIERLHLLKTGSRTRQRRLGQCSGIHSDGVASEAPQARLEDVGSGLAPVSPGWFVVNVRDAAWVTNEAFGARCLFEADVPVLRERPDIEPQRFQHLGIKLAVFDPGQPSGLYHADSAEEDFLVLRGECVARIEAEGAAAAAVGLPALCARHPSRLRRRGRRAVRPADGRLARRRPHVRLSGAGSQVVAGGLRRLPAVAAWPPPGRLRLSAALFVRDGGWSLRDPFGNRV